MIFLIIIIILIVFALGYSIGIRNIDKQKKDAIRKSSSIIKGNLSEQFAPYLPDFPFNPTEAKFIGKPIDLIVFKGMDNKDITDVYFIEVKSGRSKLNDQESKLKEAIEKKRVYWYEYRLV